MRKYETAFILDPGLDEATLDKEVKKVEELIENNKGKIIQTDRWGLRKLTYHIRKKLCSACGYPSPKLRNFNWMWKHPLTRERKK